MTDKDTIKLTWDFSIEKVNRGQMVSLPGEVINGIRIIPSGAIVNETVFVPFEDLVSVNLKITGAEYDVPKAD